MPASDPEGQTAAYSDVFPSTAPIRLLVFADQLGASQSIAFVEGLRAARALGHAAVRILDEAAFGPDEGLAGAPAARALAEAEIAETRPTAVVLSRFGHVAGMEGVFAAARAHGAPVILHIDDDLFSLPVVVGIERYRSGRHPRRIQALSAALRHANFIIAATEALAERLRAAGGPQPYRLAGKRDRRPAATTPAQALRRAGGDRLHGVSLARAGPGDGAPALEDLMVRRRDVRVELFGSIARLPAVDRLPGALVRHDVVAGDYAAFRERLAALEWDIGLAPLEASP